MKISVWIKSKFSDNGAYREIPVIRKETAITLYQGRSAGDKRQFWTSNKTYAARFGCVVEKTGVFYLVDNGNRIVDIYVSADEFSPLQVEIKQTYCEHCYYGKLYEDDWELGYKCPNCGRQKKGKTGGENG